MRVLYRHSKSESGRRRITVSGHYNDESHEMLFAVSVCRPDENFSKKEGRKRADDRVKQGVISHRQSIPPELEARLGRFFVQTADLLISAKDLECQLREQIFQNQKELNREVKSHKKIIKSATDHVTPTSPAVPSNFA